MTDNNDSLCPAAWTSVYVSPSGRLENCCISKNSLGLIDDVDDVHRFYTTGNNLEVQEQMYQGKEVSGCSVCYNNNSWTYKKLFLDKYQNLNFEPGTFDFKFFDIRWSNACNLACMYCTPEFSSTWASEIKDFKNMPKETSNALLNYTLENIENLNYVYLAGGEPLMMKENEIFLAELAEKNPNCEVLVNSNISMVGKNKIYHSLKSMSNVRWLVSMETMGEQFEYVRYPANWKTTWQNLNLLKKDFGANRVSFNMVYGNFNAMELWDTIDFLSNNGFHTQHMAVCLADMGAPGKFDLHLLKRSYLDKCLTRIESNMENYSKISAIQDTIDHLSLISPRDLETITQMLSHMLDHYEQLDNRRNLDSRSIFHNLYKARITDSIH